jgi:hypothetical protein
LVKVRRVCGVWEKGSSKKEEGQNRWVGGKSEGRGRRRGKEEKEENGEDTRKEK